MHKVLGVADDVAIFLDFLPEVKSEESHEWSKWVPHPTMKLPCDDFSLTLVGLHLQLQLAQETS